MLHTNELGVIKEKDIELAKYTYQMRKYMTELYFPLAYLFLSLQAK